MVLRAGFLLEKSRTNSTKEFVRDAAESRNESVLIAIVSTLGGRSFGLLVMSVRRSQRESRRPNWYGVDADMETPEPSVREYSVAPSLVESVTSSVSTVRRAKLAAQLASEERLADLQRRQHQIELESAEKVEAIRVEMEMAAIEERTSGERNTHMGTPTNLAPTPAPRARSARGRLDKPSPPPKPPSMRSAVGTVAESEAASVTSLHQQLDAQQREHQLKERAYQAMLQRQSEPVEQLASALGAAMKAMAPNSTDHMKRFVARQSAHKDLPLFSGSPEEWPAFLSSYERSTRECEFSPSENMARLAKALKGKARNLVAGMLTVPDNVDQVISMLRLRFGNPDLIIQSLIKRTKELNSIKTVDLESIIELTSAVRNLVSTMELLEETDHLTNPQLRQDIVAKLPNELRLRWGEHVQSLGRRSTLKDLSDWLTERAAAAYHVSPPIVGNTNTSGGEQPKRRAGQLMATISEQKRKPRACAFCEKAGHSVSSCKSFKDVSQSERRKWARSANRCYVCLGYGHGARNCQRSKPCGVDGCTSLHHPLLHPQNYEQQGQPRVSADSEQTNSITTGSHVTCSMQKPSASVILRTVPVRLKNGDNEVMTYALFDEGSTVTLVDTQLAKTLQASGPVKPLSLTWTDKQHQHHPQSMSLNLQIAGLQGDETFQLRNARTVNNLDLSCQPVTSAKALNQWPHLKDVPVHTLDNKKPQLLIGQDNVSLTVGREVIEGAPNAPIASRTKLGWVVHGRSSHRQGRVDDVVLQTISTEDEELHQLVKSSFRTDDFGVKVPHATAHNREELRAFELLQATTQRFDETRWETGLLWRKDDPVLPRSYGNALNRLRSLERKLDRNPSLLAKYDEKIAEYVDKRYAEILSPHQAAVDSNTTWYLPHFGVTNPNKPDKLRLVFDAASKTGGSSLNDALLSGPDLLRPLPAVLFGFREEAIAFGGDIQEMFHQVVIRPQDRCAQRFLWRGQDRNSKPTVYQMRVMTFGSTSSPTSAQFVKNINAAEHRDKLRAVQGIVEHHYVDDYFDSCAETKEAVKIVTDVIDIHRQGGFHIRNWVSNSPTVLEAVPIEMRAPSSIVSLDVDPATSVERTLGMIWDPSADTLGFHVSKLRLEQMLTSKSTTKRQALSTVMSVFDPLGLVACYSIRARVLIQSIWRASIGWDDELPRSLQGEWTSWCEELTELGKLAIPRCYSLKPGGVANVQLHVFCDASELAFAAVGYFRFQLNDGTVDTALVTAKSRVAPLKPLSIPRLELQAALLGARIANAITSSHRIQPDSTVFWSDSRTVLCWIKSDGRRYKPFVAHRVGELSELSNPDDWHWVSTIDNVADLASRGVAVNEIPPTSRWFTGPAFLKEPTSQWPTVPSTSEPVENDADDAELKKEFVGHAAQRTNRLCLPDPERFSSWHKLVRTTAWVVRYVRKLKASVARKSTKLPAELLASEVQHAQTLWWKTVQQDCFPDELASLRKGEPVSRSSRLYKLSAGLDDDVIRVFGRTDSAAELRPSAKRPVILDPDHRYTRLLLQQHHVWNGHHGQERMANNLRQCYWILKLRVAVRRTWTECQRCKNERVIPLQPEMGQLPECRITANVRPFTNTGMDYFGPMEVTVGRRREKRYGVLFTCMSTRAVHLEVAHSLTTDACIQSIRRMSARRGQPAAIYSDNGTNLRGADRELRESIGELDQDRLTAELTARSIEWHFNPPAAPHMGGAWERLVRSVKVALRASLTEQHPRDEALLTVFAEAESLVNGRPLTHVPLDAEDDECLTPNHFLIGTSSAALCPGVFNNADLCLRKQWRVAQALTEMFWRRWVKEYLPTLTRRTKWHQPCRQLAPGDVVVIADDKATRGVWPRGIVIAVHPGRDGTVRVADVKTTAGVYRRPVARLCYLDVRK